MPAAMSTGLILVPVIESIFGKDGNRLVIVLAGDTNNRQDADIAAAKGHWRDDTNATIGFEELSRVLDKSRKSLMRMFGPKGNPQASNLFAVIGYLQEQEGYIWKSKPGRWPEVLCISVQSKSFRTF